MAPGHHKAADGEAHDHGHRGSYGSAHQGGAQPAAAVGAGASGRGGPAAAAAGGRSVGKWSGLHLA